MKKPSMIRRFFSFLLRVIVVIALMIIIAVGSFEGVTYYLTGSLYDLRNVWKDNNTTAAVDGGTAQEEVKVDARNTKSIMFFVESEDRLRRYASLVIMNTSTRAVDLLLIPLNAQITVGGDLLADIQKHIPNAGSTLELDDIARAYGEDKYRVITDIFAQMLSVDVSGYDVMTQKKFENMLDIAGPVVYHFPDMMSYRDGSQVLKYIESGDQELDGKKAVVLMTHLNGSDKQESDRLERSDTYIEAWLQKVLGNGKGSAVIDQIQKNAVSNDHRDYTEEKEIWGDLSSDAVTLRILQGAETKGVFTIDSQKAKIQISTLLKQSAEYDSSDDQDSVTSFGDEDENEAAGSSKEYYIELYNAAFRQGLASEWESYLEEEGYNISLISSYQDEGPVSTTRIIVNQEGIGQDLLKYFPGAYIQTGEIDTGGDIQVYIGTDSTSVGTSDGLSGSSAGDGASDNTEDYNADNDITGEEEDNQYQQDEGSGNGSGYYNFDTDSE